MSLFHTWDLNRVQSLRLSEGVAGATPRSSQQQHEQALSPYQRTEEPYIGRVYRKLAYLTSGSDRARHIQAAREAWTRIDRQDLIQKLEDEFGPAPG